MMTPFLVVVMVIALVLYVLLGGADYGAGFWDLLSSGPLKEEQKILIANAIQPIWEANHVWLILIFVLLFTGFPRAFGTIMIALYVPIALMLLGIVLRGSAFVFRAYASANSDMQRTCAYIFSASSSFTPIFAGIVLASLSDDRVSVARDESLNGYLLNWLNPFSLSVGLFTLALFTYLAATYLTVEAPSPELRQAFRRRAIAAGSTSLVLAVEVFMLTGRYARSLRVGLLHDNLAHYAETVAALSLIAGLTALLKDRVRVARLMVVLFAASIVIGWAAAQYPYLARPEMTIFNSALSENVVRDILLALMAGALVLFPSLALLLYVFKDQHKRDQRKQPPSIAMPPAAFAKISPTQPFGLNPTP
jgi:cytochrome bd ubiquinol oxidase subunit II